jgi:hypothetical protein
VFKNRDRVFFLALALLLLVLRMPSFDMPLDPDSSANAFFASHMLRGDVLYDRFHPAHHLPAIYYTFEFAFRMFGDHPTSPKFLLFPWALACAWLVYLMGRSFLGEQNGILGAVFFTLISSQKWVTGMTVEMEHFANLPLIANMFLATSLFRKRAPAWQFVWIGVLGAICVLYKVTFIAPLVVAGISILLIGWMTRHEAGAIKTMLLRLTWMGIGFMLPLATTAAYFASLGLWERFMLVFEFGTGYMSDARLMGGSSLPRPFGFPLFWLSVNNIALLLFGLMGTYRLVRRSVPLRNIDSIADLALVLWFVASMALAGLRGGGFAHYVLPVLPPLAILAAIEISTAYQRWKMTSSPRSAILGAGVFVALVVINFAFSNYELYSQYVNYKTGNITHENFLHQVDPAGYASQLISQYLRTNTTPDDFIYIWSIYVDVYYYADRLPPVDILWPSYVSATGSPQRIFSPRTKYIVLDEVERMHRPQWLMDGLAADYDLETTIEGRDIYRRTQ